MSQRSAIITFCAVIAWCGWCSVASAIGISVKPTDISGAITIGESLPVNVLVSNVVNEPAVYHVSLAGPDSAISFSPTDFRLEAASNQLVTVTIKSWLPGTHINFVQVVGRPLGGSGFAANPGVRVPLSVVVKLGMIGRVAIGALFILACACIYFFLNLKNKKKV